MPPLDSPQQDSTRSPLKEAFPGRLPTAGPSLPLEVGLEHLRAGRHERAIAALRQALRREPGRFAAVRGLATAYLAAGNARSARKVLIDFTAANPMSAEGWRLAAQLEWKLGDRPRAIEVLYVGLKRLPQSQILHRQLAVFLAAEGRTPASAVHCSGLLENTPSNEVGGGTGVPPPAAGFSDHDWLDQIAGDPVLLSAILTDSPASFTSPEPLSEETRRMLLAIEWKLARLLEAQPNHADRQLLLARLQSRLDAIPAALLSVRRALRVNPDLMDAHRLMARLHARIGETDQAIAILNGLLSRGVHWPDVHYEMAELQWRLGRDAEARSHLYSAIRLNPRYDQARALLERMAA